MAFTASFHRRLDETRLLSAQLWPTTDRTSLCSSTRVVCLSHQRILHAIQQADPFYDHVKWAEEAQQNEVYMRNICQMPQALRPVEDEDNEEGMDDDVPR